MVPLSIFNHNIHFLAIIILIVVPADSIPIHQWLALFHQTHTQIWIVRILKYLKMTFNRNIIWWDTVNDFVQSNHWFIQSVKTSLNEKSLVWKILLKNVKTTLKNTENVSRKKCALLNNRLHISFKNRLLSTSKYESSKEHKNSLVLIVLAPFLQFWCQLKLVPSVTERKAEKASTIYDLQKNVALRCLSLLFALNSSSCFKNI